MDAGLLYNSGHQQPVGLDGGTGITLGSDGQIRIDNNDGSVSHPENSDINPWDDSQTFAAASHPTETTRISSSPITSAPLEALFSDTIPPYATSEVGFTWPGTSPIPTASSISNQSPLINPIIASAIPTIPISFGYEPDAIISTESLPSIYITFSWVSWATSTPISVSSPSASLIASSASLSTASASVTSASAVTSSISSLISTLHTSSPSSYAVVPKSVTSSASTSPTSGEQAPSETIVAPPIPANFNVHSPTFYAGIALGAIIAIGLIASSTAWWVRRRSRRKRSAQLMVPWGRSGNNDGGGLEAGYGAADVDVAALAALNLGSREDLAHVQAWSPRGDRDVGEPKRADGYFNGPFYGLSVPRFSGGDDSIGTSTGRRYPGSGPGNVQIRHLPSHLVADDFTAYRSNDEKHDCLTYPQDAFFPDAGAHDISRDTWSGMDGQGMQATPGRNKHSPPPPRSMAERLRNRGKPADDAHGVEPGPLPAPEIPQLGNEEFAQWGHSIKSSLVNAFNAVASNLGAGAPQEKGADKLTAPPSRRSTRKSIRSMRWEEAENVRSGSISTTVSKPWTLEEIEDGAGVVHLHLPELDELNHDTTRPHLSQTLSLRSGDNIAACNDVDGVSRRAHIPLKASCRPQQALLLKKPPSFRQRSIDTVNGFTPSRGSSVYSTISARSSALTQDRHRLPRIPSASGSLGGETVHMDEEDSVVIQPDAISRLSSSDSSLIPPARGARASSADAFAAHVLQARQKRLAESQN